MTHVEERLELLYKRLCGRKIKRFDHPNEIELHIGEFRQRLFLWEHSGEISRSASSGTMVAIWLDVCREYSSYKKASGENPSVQTLTELDKLLGTEQEDAAFAEEFDLCQKLHEQPEPATADPGAHYRFKYTVQLSEADIAAKRVTINLDPFRIAAIYNMQGFPEQTALKKILCAGNRGHNSKREDYLDIISAMERALQMLDEDAANAGI